VALRHPQLRRRGAAAVGGGVPDDRAAPPRYGTTWFLSDATPRNGQQSALAIDAIALMDALDIDRAVVAGFDWGARTADILATLWPERCTGPVRIHETAA
jgi:hypothetical protein